MQFGKMTVFLFLYFYNITFVPTGALLFSFAFTLFFFFQKVRWLFRFGISGS